MKQPRFLARSITLALALLTGIGAVGGTRAANAQGASSLNMRLVGTNDLQARSTYQPTLPHKTRVLVASQPPPAAMVVVVVVVYKQQARGAKVLPGRRASCVPPVGLTFPRASEL